LRHALTDHAAQILSWLIFKVTFGAEAFDITSTERGRQEERIWATTRRDYISRETEATGENERKKNVGTL
jgi:hypothetical protein